MTQRGGKRGLRDYDKGLYGKFRRCRDVIYHVSKRIYNVSIGIYNVPNGIYLNSTNT